MSRKLRVDLRQLTSHDGKPLRFTAGQLSFLRSRVPRVMMFGGFGSGKSLPLCVKTLMMGLWHGKGYSGQLVSPSYPMFLKNIWPVMRDDLLMKLGDVEGRRTLWDLCKWNANEKRLTLPNGFELWFVSATDPNAMRGANLAFIAVDEATVIPKFPALYVSATSRLRRGRPSPHTRAPVTQLFGVGTPEGMDGCHDQFCIPPIDEKQRAIWHRTHQVIRVSSLDNPGLPPDFISQQMLGIPEALLDAYIRGLHVDVGRGRCYYNFSQESNVTKAAEYDPSLDLRLSFDFNVDPMSCTIHQVRGGRHLVTVDEVILRNSNTPEVCLEFIRRYGTQGHRHSRDLWIHGDASDKVGISNYDEIEEYLRDHFPGRIIRKVPSANPRHSVRLKSVNAMAKNARGEVRWWVNPRCRWTIRDLVQQRMDGNSKDKRQEADDGTLLGHASDTVDYVIHSLWPYRRMNARDVVSSRMTQHVT